jgi:ferritin-like metal-binding protein YciE
MAHNEMVIAWLNDAYGMEQSITHVLENHARDAKDHPQIQGAIKQHLEATKRHADMVKQEIERLGGSTSAVKSAMSHVMGMGQSVSTGMAKDELVKNALADYSTEHMEIASYRALQAAAMELGDQQLARTCEMILADEMAMAQFLEQNLPMIVTMTLQQQMREHLGDQAAGDMNAHP